MLENELKRLWASSSENVQIKIKKVSEVYSFEKKLGEIHRSIAVRNYVEYFSGLIVVVAFGFYLTTGLLSTFQIVGAVLTIMAVPFVLFRIWKTHQGKKSIALNMPLVVQLKAMRSYFLNEKEMLEKVGSWYLLPFLPGFILFHISNQLMHQTRFVITSFLFCITLGIVIWYTNKKVAKKKFQPLLEEIEQQIVSWENIEN